MATKPRIGSDPLEWIQDSRAEEREEGAKVSTPSKQRTRSKPSKLEQTTPTTIESEPKKSTQAGLRDGWTRATFIIREGQLDKLKNLAWWERKEIKQVLDEALSAHLAGKKVPPRAQPSGE